MKFSFANLDPSDWSRSFFVVVDVSLEDYKGLSLTFKFLVTECLPSVPEVSKALDDLNKHRNFYLFLKQIRAAFKSSLNLANAIHK